jgi:hypothetical protein
MRFSDRCVLQGQEMSHHILQVLVLVSVWLGQGNTFLLIHVCKAFTDATPKAPSCLTPTIFCMAFDVPVCQIPSAEHPEAF